MVQLHCETCGAPVDRQDVMRGEDYFYTPETGEWRKVLYVFYGCTKPTPFTVFDLGHSWGIQRVMGRDIPQSEVPERVLREYGLLTEPATTCAQHCWHQLTPAQRACCGCNSVEEHLDPKPPTAASEVRHAS